MTTLAQLARRMSDLERRVNAIQAGTVGATPGPTYGPNVLTNPAMESGSTGWRVIAELGYPVGGPTISVETTAPLDGSRSLKISEAANAAAWIGHCPSGIPATPTISGDVFPTSGGDTWLLSALLQADHATLHAQLIAICGVTPADALQLDDGVNTLWVETNDLPLAAGQATTLYGTVTIPAGMNFIGFAAVAAASGTPPTSAWSWLLDVCSLQQRTN